MAFFSSSKQNRLKKVIGKIPFLPQSENHSLGFLNATQFLGVINDNVFKFVMAFLLIDALGTNRASEILSATGAIYVIPFLLFSSSAGILADRFSKQKLLVVMKSAEILLMILALFAFALKSVWACYTLLFFLSTHSAMFGPSKYGIIPELVPTDRVSRANGLITSFTYLAIIVGTFLASFLTEITDRHFVLIAGFCLLVAIAGFITSFGIKKTPAQDSNKKMNLFFVREIFQTLATCRKQKHLLPAIFGSAYFLFIGAFTQLNIIPFAIQSLHFSEVAGGYLFLSTALGIAFGSFLAGRASRKRIELGISCLAGVGITLFFLLLSLFSTHLIFVIICLVSIGVLGGIFIVPFDSYIQLYSENDKRGQTIGAANFLSFSGVLVASLCLFLFNQIFDLSSAASFGVIGVLTLAVTAILTARLSDFSLSFFSRKILYPFYHFKRPHVEAIEQSDKTILILEKGCWRDALLLMGSIPNLHLFIPVKETHRNPWYIRIFYSFHCIRAEESFEQLLTAAKAHLKEGIVPCLFLENHCPKEIERDVNPLLDFFRGSFTKILVAQFDKTPEGLTVHFKKHS
jgi:acyl-[acyl-carrier-protein]-phospholipid O-acyltransferase/long-chain-fatty-acid--[acyl-carrier-protein] ligase